MPYFSVVARCSFSALVPIASCMVPAALHPACRHGADRLVRDAGRFHPACHQGEPAATVADAALAQ